MPAPPTRTIVENGSGVEAVETDLITREPIIPVVHGGPGDAVHAEHLPGQVVREILSNITGREGYPRQFLRRTSTQWGGSRTDLRILDDATEYRHEDITTFDARVEKEFTFNDFNLTVGIDGFNLFNDATVLQRRDADRLVLVGRHRVGDLFQHFLAGLLVERDDRVRPRSPGRW